MTKTPSDATELRAAIAALIGRFGSEASKQEVLAQTKKRTGAPQLPDFSLLHPQFERDARRLLSGETYLDINNAQIARDFAARYPNPMVDAQSIKRRIKRKLRKRRELFVLYNAFLISKTESPWWVHRAITEILAEVDEGLGIWDRFLKGQDFQLDRWCERHGKLQELDTFAKLEEELQPAARRGMAPIVRLGHNSQT